MTTQMTETEKKKVKVPQAQARLKATSLGVLSPPSPYEMSRVQARHFIDQAVTCQLLLDEITADDLPYLHIDASGPDTIRIKITLIRQHLDMMEGLLP